MMKSLKFLSLIVAAFIAASPLMAQAEIKAGKDYVPLNPPMEAESGKKVEVIEFFYYGCSHCNDLEPALNAWIAKMPADVQFKRIPAVFRESWVPLTALFYTLEAMGQLDKLHHKAFESIHGPQKLNLSDDKLMADWAAQNGLDRQKFTAAYQSFGVQNKVKRARQLTVAYNVQGTPSLVVDGKYLTSSGMAGGHAEVMKVLDELIARARKERGGK